MEVLIEEEPEKRRSIYRSKEGSLIRIETIVEQGEDDKEYEVTSKMMADELLLFTDRETSFDAIMTRVKEGMEELSVDYCLFKVGYSMLKIKFFKMEGKTLLDTLDQVREALRSRYHLESYTNGLACMSNDRNHANR
jgi:hypothetical protein